MSEIGSSSNEEEPQKASAQPQDDSIRRVSNGDAESRKQALKQKLERMRLTVKEEKTPSPLDLDVAIINGDLDKIRHLIDTGVDSNALTSAGYPMLMVALLLGQQDVATLLRESGAEYRLMEAALAGDTKTLHVLLDGGEGDDVNQPDRRGSYALSHAASKGPIEAVRLLIEHGADPNAPNQAGYTPLSIACASGFPEVAYLLAEAGASIGIVEAAYLGDLPLLKRLLDDGADIEMRDAAQATPLMAASASGHIECVRFLLERGANPHAENSHGQKAITFAITSDRVAVIHLLIEHGVDANAMSSRIESTLLGSAITSGKVQAVKALLARGADPNLAGGRNVGGRTPLHLCASSALNRSFRKNDAIDAMPRIAALLLDAGAQIEARDSQQYTPLIVAAADGDAEIVRLLLERGADVRASTPNGFHTPLSRVRENDRYGDKTEARTLIMEALGPEYAVYDSAERGDVERLTGLLEAGAPADESIVFEPRRLKSEHFSKDDLHETPLTVAAGKGHLAVVNLLLARGDVSRTSMNDALFRAEQENHVEIARILREAGAVN